MPEPRHLRDVSEPSIAATGPVPSGNEGGTRRFPLAFRGPVGVASRLFTGGAEHAWIEVGDEAIVAKYGLWTVRTTRANVAEVHVTGPYAPWKVGGPPHLSFRDGGLTFATNTDRGVCLLFTSPVAGIEPLGRVRHRGLTVTVADPDGLVAALER